MFYAFALTCRRTLGVLLMISCGCSDLSETSQGADRETFMRPAVEAFATTKEFCDDFSLFCLPADWSTTSKLYLLDDISANSVYRTLEKLETEVMRVPCEINISRDGLLTANIARSKQNSILLVRDLGVQPNPLFQGFEVSFDGQVKIVSIAKTDVGICFLCERPHQRLLVIVRTQTALP